MNDKAKIEALRAAIKELPMENNDLVLSREGRKNRLKLG